jgi:hypothetical protein
VGRAGSLGWIAGTLGLALGVELVFARKAHAGRGRDPALPSPGPSSYPSGMPLADAAYTMATWTPTIHRLILAEFPRLAAQIAAAEPFAITWGQMESGGNPCSVGNPGQLGPDGNPAEIGLGQLYNPDDFRAFKISTQSFRAYAPTAAPLAAAYRQAVADLTAAKKAGRPDTDPAVIDAKRRMASASHQIQSRTRPLTQAEMDDQVRWTLLAKVNEDLAVADRAVAQYSIAHWSAPDFWKLVKAPHALPAILGNGLPAVVKKLGRAPASWHEFRAVLGMEGNPQWVRALNACEECGNAVAPAVG